MIRHPGNFFNAIFGWFAICGESFYSPLKLSRCVKKKDCLWKSSMATTMGPSRLLRRVFLDPLLSAINDSSMVRTMYSCGGKTKVERQKVKNLLLTHSKI